MRKIYNIYNILSAIEHNLVLKTKSRWRKIKFNWIDINPLFNKLIRCQNKDYKQIPIIIISFNQLFFLRKLISFLKVNNYNNIIIIDNASTYPPLLEYLKEIENSVKIHWLSENQGHMALWRNKKIFDYYSKGFYAVTDPDIVPKHTCPSDFMLYFKNILMANNTLTKVGFSLDLENIPDANPYKEKIIRWEKKFWTKKTKQGDYISPIDTTFALYRPMLYEDIFPYFFEAIRTAKPYTALHGGWHINPDELTREQKYYFETANSSHSWKFDKNGELNNPEYSQE